MVSTRVIRRLLAAAAAVMLVAFQTAAAARACVMFDDAPHGQAPASQPLNFGAAADAPSGHELCPAQNPFGSGIQLAVLQMPAIDPAAAPVTVSPGYASFVSALAAGTAKAWTASTEPPPLAIVHCCYRK